MEGATAMADPPLSGSVGYAEKGATMFQYYLKIVPTTYARADGSLFLTNQGCDPVQS